MRIGRRTLLVGAGATALAALGAGAAHLWREDRARRAIAKLFGEELADHPTTAEFLLSYFSRFPLATLRTSDWQMRRLLYRYARETTAVLAAEANDLEQLVFLGGGKSPACLNPLSSHML